MSIVTLIHISVGTVGLLGGLVALFTRKGSQFHKLGGRAFVVGLLSAAVTTFIFMRQNFLPLAVVMALATIYLIATSMLALKRERVYAKPLEIVCMLLGLALILFPSLRIAVAIRSNDVSALVAPSLLMLTFLLLFIQDIGLLRNRDRSKLYWIKRHFSRMILAFAFGVMALVRIGANFGLSLEMSVVIPLIVAFGVIAYFYRSMERSSS